MGSFVSRYFVGLNNLFQVLLFFTGKANAVLNWHDLLKTAIMPHKEVHHLVTGQTH